MNWKFFSLVGCLFTTLGVLSAEVTLPWKKLAPVPDALGFGGAFGGVSGHSLIIAGGSNFPEKMPWEGGQKAWYDTAFALGKPDGAWESICRLPRPLGYGTSISVRDGLYCIGGSGATEHVRDVFRIVRGRDGWKCEMLPPLPLRLAYSCGALVDGCLYVAGGTQSPDATNTMKIFLSFDLKKPSKGWRELEAWPGPGRMLAVAASVAGRFYLVSGASLGGDEQGKPVRTYLTDAYCYSPGKGWKRLADMPAATVAAPTPAPQIGKSRFLVIGGDDGTLVNFEPKSQHPGFPSRILSYDTKADLWTVAGTNPAPRATAPVAQWKGLTVIASGEARPGVRSPEVWAARIKP